MSHDAGSTVPTAALSRGASNDSIYAMVARVVRQASAHAGVLIDIGCGTGTLSSVLFGTFDRYVGCDLVAYERFPRAEWASFIRTDLEQPSLPIADATGDVVAAVETIEHVENPRAFVRELARITRPKGLVIVTTPNQLSLASKATLMSRNQFGAFQDCSYPAHLTALLESDLLRIARECGLAEPCIHWSNSGRIPLTSRHWPKMLRGRAFSDNVLLSARKR
jgi:2-polyprenyl-3-methyl-5-hydroxy-6-metoxy-1,4-benzoquinol methylase